jgi:hypothetical protein
LRLDVEHRDAVVAQGDDKRNAELFSEGAVFLEHSIDRHAAE